MNNKFKESEVLGREIFKQTLSCSSKVNNYYFTEDQYCPVDVIWENNDEKYVGEIKYRSGYTSTDKIIQNGGALLEKSKYDELKEYQYNSGYTPIYITEFSDGVGYIWDLSDMNNITWSDKFLPKTTNANNGKRDKAITYLPLDKGKRFKFKKLGTN